VHISRIPINSFSVYCRLPGKTPVSARDSLIKELKAQGKWQEEVQTENNQTEPSTNSNLPLAFENVPFISPIWTLAALFVVFIQKKK
jgi:hypothetical protein